MIQPATARAAEGEQEPERALALGVKAGIIPPVLVAAEFLIRPVPHLATGIFGIVTAGGIGGGGTRATLGAELIYEFQEGRRSSPYMAGSYAYYHAAAESVGGFYETMHVLYATGGFVWKWNPIDLYVGGGLIAVLSDETPPCTGWGCIELDLPPVLPTAEAGVRVAFP